MPGHPGAQRLDLVETRHGMAVSDPYRWLEDPQDPRTIAWMAGQDEYFAAQRAAWPVEDWHDELAALSAVDAVSPPLVRGGRSFHLRQLAGADHPTLLVTEDGHERALVSPGALDPTGRTVLDAWKPSVEGDLLAYQLSTGGTEDSRLWVMEVATRHLVEGPIDRVRRSPIAWLPGGGHYYYVRRDDPAQHPGEERFHRRVCLHRVGSDPAEDVVVFGEGRDKTQFYSIDVTADGRWLRISATTGTDPGTDCWLADLADSSWHAPDLRPIQEGEAARTIPCLPYGGGTDDPLWLRTTRGAPLGRVMTVTPAGLDGEWRELIAERPGAVLTDFAALTGPGLPRTLALVAWTRHAVSEITLHDLADGTRLGDVPLPGAGHTGSFVVPRDGAHEAWFTYTDHQTPPTVVHFDGRTGRCAAAAPGNHDVHIGHISFESRDGTTVRMFVLSPGGEPDHPRPAILTGYGGFGVSMTPGYSPEALAWVRAGGVYAVACLRGGGEEGQDWHRAGRGPHKQNVFDDFDAATDHLIEAGWTSPDLLAIMGGSNGGLLMGATLTRHPEKYAAAVCLSGLFDMARYELSGLGPSWRPEYGTADDPDQLRVLLSYSPYHHVKGGMEYPDVLLTAPDADTRVDPSHSRKMCAALQYATSGSGPVMFRRVPDAGHGALAQSRAVAMKAEWLAFLGTRLGLKVCGGRA